VYTLANSVSVTPTLYELAMMSTPCGGMNVICVLAPPRSMAPKLVLDSCGGADGGPGASSVPMA